MSGEPERPRGRTPEERQALLDRIRARLDLPMAVLALVWVVVIVVDLAEVLPPALRPLAVNLDLAIWAFFLVEFLLELAIAPDRLAYLRDNWVIGLSVLLPFFGVFRLLRAFYALRALALGRVVLGANRAAQGAAQILGRGGFQYVALIVLVATLLGAAGVYFFERGNPQSDVNRFPQALWWAAALITTINTNLEPVSLEGRILAFILRVVALSVFGYLTASIASYLVGEEAAGGRRAQELAELRRQLAEIQARLDRLLPPPPNDT